MTTRHKDALTIQNACNVSGVAHAVIRACQEVRDEGGDGNALYKDPAIRLMVHQLAFLTGMEKRMALSRLVRLKRKPL